jgi:hypothetical protein
MSEQQDIEEWRPVVGHEGSYEVSSAGRVRSLDRDVSRGPGVLHVVGRNLRAVAPASPRGYPRVTLWRAGVAEPRDIHRVVCDAFRGPLPRGQQTRHIDGNRFNNKIDNLVYGSPSDNQRDRASHGTSNRGAANGHAKLTKEAVKEIRASQSESSALALEFGISKTHVRAIRGRRAWAWLP